MPERPLDDVLALLEGPVEPDPGFESRLRARLAAELVGGEAPREATDRDEPDEEVLELEATVERPTIRWSWRWTAAAAAVAAVAVTALVVTRDDRTSTTADTSAQTYAGAELTTVVIEQGTNPYFVAVADDAWVLSLGGTLTRLDGETGAVLGVTTVPESSPLTVDEHAVWVADAVDGDVLRLDLETGEVVARIPTGVEVLPSAIRLPMLEGEMSRQFSLIGGITSDGSSVWVGDRAGRVMRVDPATHDIEQSFAVGVRPDLLQVDGDDLLVADPEGGEAVVVDVRTGEELFAAEPVEQLAGAALHGGALFLQDATNGVVTRIDLESGDEVTSPALGASPSAPGQPTLPTGLVVGDAGVLVATDTAPGSVHVLDPVTLAERGTLAVSADRGDMTIGPDGTAWVVRTGERTVVRVEPVG